jgi:two-component system chemotaxis response regulator CheB
MRLRTLVADDSVVFRKVLSDALAAMPDVEVVGTASNGRQALQRVRELQPDLLTLDMEMPEMDGLAVLDALKQSGNAASVIVVSALTRKGGTLTLRALEKGAFDFITKPDTATGELGREAIHRELCPRVKALMSRHEIRNILRGRSGQGASPPRSVPSVRPAAPVASAPGKAGSRALDNITGRMNHLTSTVRPEMVLIGVSTGGPNALARLLPAIPGNIGVPFLVVQHMPPMFTQSLADSLGAKCAMQVCEASSGDVVKANTVYIAPGGRQMRIHPASDGGKVLQITDDPPENNCRPAADYLFRSAASHYPGRSMAVILTGMGNDGATGLRLLRRNGCPVIAQDEATCVVYGMPKAAVEAKVVDWVLPLDSIAGRIVTTVRGGPG